MYLFTSWVCRSILSLLNCSKKANKSVKENTHIAYDRYEMNSGNARFSDALIQVDLHSFDQNILSFENVLFQTARIDLIKSSLRGEEIKHWLLIRVQLSSTRRLIKSGNHFLLFLFHFLVTYSSFYQPESKPFTRFGGETCLTESYSSKEICVWQIVSNQRFVNDRLVSGKQSKYLYMYTHSYTHPSITSSAFWAKSPQGQLSKYILGGLIF